jgi:hypothetical protein
MGGQCPVDPGADEGHPGQKLQQHGELVCLVSLVYPVTPPSAAVTGNWKLGNRIF